MTSDPVDLPTTSVFVLELVSTGFFGTEIGDSFRREGRAMLDSVLADFRRIPGWVVSTLTEPVSPGRFDHLQAAISGQRAASALIIAPEFDGLLEFCCDAARRAGMLLLNCGDRALALGADKWQLDEHLREEDLPTIPTTRRVLSDGPPDVPGIVKPRFGAGSWLVRHVTSRDEWPEIAALYGAAGLSEALWQPYLPGRAVSVAALIPPDQPPRIFPVAEQRLSHDGEFRYLGGIIPADLRPEEVERVQALASACLATLPGLCGLTGLDLIVPREAPLSPVIVEFNPRLTTSYIGYRRLCVDNLMEQLITPARRSGPLRWHPGNITFEPEGACCGERMLVSRTPGMTESVIRQDVP